MTNFDNKENKLERVFFANGWTKRSSSDTHCVLYRWDDSYEKSYLFHDPHPSQEGLIQGSEYEFWYLEKLK